MLKVGDTFDSSISNIENNSVNGYTIEDSKGNTLWRNLPDDYVLKGTIKSVTKSFFQTDDNVNMLIVKRTSEGLSYKRIRKYFIIWQRMSNENIII